MKVERTEVGTESEKRNRRRRRGMREGREEGKEEEDQEVYDTTPLLLLPSPSGLVILLSLHAEESASSVRGWIIIGEEEVWVGREEWRGEEEDCILLSHSSLTIFQLISLPSSHLQFTMFLPSLEAPLQQACRGGHSGPLGHKSVWEGWGRVGGGRIWESIQGYRTLVRGMNGTNRALSMTVPSLTHRHTGKDRTAGADTLVRERHAKSSVSSARAIRDHF
jgi:hypothetical protein